MALERKIALELKDASKSFGGVCANDKVSLRVEAGSIHGLIGENGAGKSTAAKILYGLYSPDSGEIRVRGELKNWSTPADAIHAGIGMVHQHFMLAGPHTALDNVILGSEPFISSAGWLPRIFRPLDRKRAKTRLEEICRDLKFQMDWNASVDGLSVGVQQRIEIIKLLYRRAEILILDEPTAVLTPQETEELFEVLRKLKAQGKTILIITHKLKEIMAITDRVTVFRAGRVSGEIETKDASLEKLAELMVGRQVRLHGGSKKIVKTGDEICSLQGVTLKEKSGRRRLSDVSLQIRAGEVLGIAGVEGNGQTELLECLMRPLALGDRGELTGQIRILGQSTALWPTSRIRSLDVGFVAQDRHREGILLQSTCQENFLLDHQRQRPFSRRGWLNRSVLLKTVTEAMEKFDVRPRDPRVPIGSLSGGNQQKLVVARELFKEPRLLIVAQPTRGVDIGAIEFIHSKILEARARGAGVLLVSSELDEVLALSDRILVFFEGRIAGEFNPDQEKQLGIAMGGGK